MRTFIPLTLILCALSLPTRTVAASIPIVYQGSFVEGSPGVDQGLPVFVCQCLNNVRFKFFVPDFAALSNINSITASVEIFDNVFQNGFERGSLLFVLNGVGPPPGLDNVVLNTFGSSSGGFVGPQTVTGSLPGASLLDALTEIQGDGIFFIRVNREGNNRAGNDFFVTDPLVTIDGDLASIPEPSSASLIVVGLLAGLAGVVRRKRASR